MNRKVTFSFLLVCLLALSVVFVSCKNDPPPGLLPGLPSGLPARLPSDVEIWAEEDADYAGVISVIISDTGLPYIWYGFENDFELYINGNKYDGTVGVEIGSYGGGGLWGAGFDFWLGSMDGTDPKVIRRDQQYTIRVVYTRNPARGIPFVNAREEPIAVVESFDITETVTANYY
jgi:hypothetical protein